MGESAPAWFKFYPEKWINDERIIRLDYDAQGVLVQIMCWAWSRQSDHIPDDEKLICRRLNLHPNKWRVIRASLTSGTDPILSENRQGFLTYSPHGPALVSAKCRQNANRDAGRISASKRAKSQETDSTQCQHDVEQSRVDKSREEKNPPSPPKPVATLPDWVPVDAWNGYLELRKRKRAPLTERALSLAVKELEKLRGEGFDPGEVLDQSTLKGWVGLFPLKAKPAEPITDGELWAKLEAEGK